MLYKYLRAGPVNEGAEKMSSSSIISFRESIRWIPDPASEPTNTVVLTGGKTGVFIDIRFLKDSSDLDWAFAGYRQANGHVDRVDDSCVRITIHFTLPVSRTLADLFLVHVYRWCRVRPFDRLWSSLGY